MRPRSTFLSVNSWLELSDHLNYADRAMTKAFTNVLMSVFLNVRSSHAALNKVHEQLDILLMSKPIRINYAFHPHSLFAEVYQEPNGLELVKSFLTLLKGLPSDLEFLQTSYIKFFEDRLRDILYPEVVTRLLAPLTDKKIHDSMSTIRNFQRMSRHHQDLFLQILLKIKKRFIVQRENDNRLQLTKENICFNLDLTVAELLAITQELDKALQAELAVCMMHYLTDMTERYQALPPPHQNAQAFEIIFLEVKNKKSRLAFYNMQLDFPIIRHSLVNIIETGFQARLGRGLNLEPCERHKYFVGVIGVFYREFPDVCLTKNGAVHAAQKLISQISQSKLLIQEKLTQFQALFALTEYYVNTHSNHWIDGELGIDNTRTWKRLMSIIRYAAFTQLTDRTNYPQPIQSSQYLSVLESALTLPLFSQHRGNYSNLFFYSKTDTVEKIEALIQRNRDPREMIRYR
jgi:hypothetical protein